MTNNNTKRFAAQRERDYDRSREHNSHRIALLEYFQSIPQDAPLHYWPTTSELQDMKQFGLRPVNRIGDLRDGKVEHYRYDIEKISCGHGINRWRFHWPNRPGHPKSKDQTVLSLDPEPGKKSHLGNTRADRAAWFERTFRISPGRKQAEPEPEWSLTP